VQYRLAPSACQGVEITLPLPHQRHADRADAAIADLKQATLADGNVFDALMRAVRTRSLSQISRALYEVGGQYRRNM